MPQLIFVFSILAIIFCTCTLILTNYEVIPEKGRA